MPKSIDLDALKSRRPFGSAQQKEAVDLFEQLGSTNAVAETLGISPSAVLKRFEGLRKRAAERGWSPEHDCTHLVPEGYHVKGVSTYYNKEGKPSQQWVKSQKDQRDRLEALLEAVGDIAEPFRGLSEVPAEPAVCDEDLLCVYPMGDPHIGMYAWAEETGQDFDLHTVETHLCRAVDKLVGLAPDAHTALIVDLGDYFHADNQSGVTARGGNVLDTDTRWAKVLRVGVRIARRIIDRALEKHREVHFISEIGNHDDHSAIVLATCLDLYYENNPRVVIDTSPSTFHWFRFGNNLIGVTHGHNTKPQNLPLIMAHDRKEDWGDTEHRYWYTGHVHHDSVKEYAGVLVETFRTLASRDAWHHSKGYRSGRDMKCDVLHRDYGRINRHIVGVNQLWGSR